MSVVYLHVYKSQGSIRVQDTSYFDTSLVADDERVRVPRWA